jgi:hypothetical protein
VGGAAGPTSVTPTRPTTTAAAAATSPAAGSRSASPAEEPFGRSATTAQDGIWTINGLYPTSYKVAFGAGYQAWAFGKSDWASADVVVVGPGATTRVDDMLFLPATISGTVTDAATGAPIEGVCLSLESTDPEGGGASGACTDESGAYRADYVTPGGYRVLFYDPQGRYAFADYADGAVVVVARGAQLSGIDGSLAVGAVLTGRVVDALTRQPVEGVCAQAFQGRSGGMYRFQQQTCSQADGIWRLWALPAGGATVHFNSDGVHRETWAYSSTTQAKATVFELTAGATTTLRDVRLRRAR